MNLDGELVIHPVGLNLVGFTRAERCVGDQFVKPAHPSPGKGAGGRVHPEHRPPAPDGQGRVMHLAGRARGALILEQLEAPHQCIGADLMRGEAQMSIRQDNLFGRDTFCHCSSLHPVDQPGRIRHMPSHHAAQGLPLRSLEQGLRNTVPGKNRAVVIGQNAGRGIMFDKQGQVAQRRSPTPGPPDMRKRGRHCHKAKGHRRGNKTGLDCRAWGKIPQHSAENRKPQQGSLGRIQALGNRDRSVEIGHQMSPWGQQVPAI